MFYFLQPIWLWASSAVIIPVLIHLWNVKQGKTLKVGSIALFAKSAASHTKSFRIKDWLLLLLRCALIMILAMLIAKPVWKQENTAKEKGWILVEKGSIGEAYKKYHTTIDTWLHQGYALHYFDESFESASLKDTLTESADTTKNALLSYWVLLKILEQKLPPRFPVQLFTNNRLQRFYGNRPGIALPFKWHIISSKDTTAKWLEKARLTVKDSIQVTEGNSTSLGTFFTHQNISLNSNNSGYNIIRQDGRIAVSDAAKQMTEADTSTATIIIYATAFAADAAYVEAALNAVKDVTQRRMNIRVVDNKKDIPVNTDWIFWLSDEPVPQVNQNIKLFVYEKGESKTTHSWLIADNEQTLTATQNIQLYKRVESGISSSQIIWKDGYGEPVLSKQNGNQSIYHFYSRFNPQWSDLVWSTEFPKLMYNLVFDEQSSMSKSNIKDDRIIDSSQMLPQLATEKYVSRNSDAAAEEDLSVWLWSFAFLLFFAERILSFRKQNIHEA